MPGHLVANQTGADQVHGARHQKGSARNFISLPAQLLDSSNCSNFSTHPLPLSTVQLICPAHAFAKIQIGCKVSYLYSVWVSPVSLLSVEVLLSPLVIVVRDERL